MFNIIKKIAQIHLKNKFENPRQTPYNELLMSKKNMCRGQNK